VQNGTHFYTREEAEHGLRLIADWAAFHDRVSFYSFPVGGGFWGLPSANTDWVRRLMPHLKRHEFLGVKLATLCYAAMQPDLYLYVRLLWDADLDVDLLVDEYYHDLFGQSAPLMRRYHRLIGDSWSDNYKRGLAGARGAEGSLQAVVDIFEPVAAECRALLDEAARKAPTDVVRQRVGVFAENFHLAEMLLEAIQTRRRIRVSEEPSATDLRRLDDLGREWREFTRARAGTHAVDVVSIEKMGKANDIFALR
jgi:hypothetical protein